MNLYRPSLNFAPMTQGRKPWDSIPLLFEKIAVKVACRKGIWLSFKDLHDKIPPKKQPLG